MMSAWRTVARERRTEGGPAMGSVLISRCTACGKEMATVLDPRFEESIRKGHAEGERLHRVVCDGELVQLTEDEATYRERMKNGKGGERG